MPCICQPAFLIINKMLGAEIVHKDHEMQIYTLQHSTFHTGAILTFISQVNTITLFY